MTSGRWSRQAGRRRVWAVAGVVWILAAVRVVAAVPLAALVPADVGLCFETRDLARHVAEFRESPWYARLADHPLAKSLAVAAGQHAKKVSRQLENQLGLPLETLVLHLLERETLVAVWPGEASAEGTGLWLVRSPDSELLQRTFDHLLDQQRRAGRLLESRKLTISGRQVQIEAIQPQPNRQTVFAAVLGDLGIVSTSAALVERALRTELGAVPESPGLADLAPYKAAMARLEPETVVRMFLSPRPWDHRMAIAPEPAERKRDLVRQGMCALWQSTEYLVAGLTLDRELRGELHLAIDRASLPPAGQRIVESFSGSSHLARQVPLGTIVAVIGRIDFRHLIDALLAVNAREDFIGLSGKPAEGMPLSIVLGLAACVGPDIGFFVLPPDRPIGVPEVVSPAWPLDWLVGIETQSLEPGAESPPLAALIVPLLRRALQIATGIVDSQGTGEQSSQAEASVKENNRASEGLPVPGLPAERSIALAQVKQMIWLASTQALTEYAADGAREQLRYRLETVSSLVYVDLAGLRRLLLSNPRWPAILAPLMHVDEPTAGHKLPEIDLFLQLADVVLAEAGFDRQGFSCAWRVGLSNP